MPHFSQNLMFTLHKGLVHFDLIYLLFVHDFDSAWSVNQKVVSRPNVSEGTLSQHFPFFVAAVPLALVALLTTAAAELSE